MYWLGANILNIYALHRTCNGKIDQNSPDMTSRYTEHLPQGFKGAVICAGPLTHGKKGLCQGDSGGPIMLPQLSSDGQLTTWYIYGIVLGGIPEFCGSRQHPTQFIRLDDKEISSFLEANIGGYDIPRCK